jgi:hypothetical protein
MRADPLARAMRPDKATLLGVAGSAEAVSGGLAATRARVEDDRRRRLAGLRERADAAVAGVRRGRRGDAHHHRRRIAAGDAPS